MENPVDSERGVISLAPSGSPCIADGESLGNRPILVIVAWMPSMFAPEHLFAAVSGAAEPYSFSLFGSELLAAATRLSAQQLASHPRRV
jgi:hypothetical protein